MPCPTGLASLPSLYLSVCLLVHRRVQPSIHLLSASPSMRLFVCLSVKLSIHPSSSVSVRLSVHLSVNLMLLADRVCLEKTHAVDVASR